MKNSSLSIGTSEQRNKCRVLFAFEVLRYTYSQTLHLVNLYGKGSWIVHAFSVFKRVPLLQGFWQLDPAAMQPWRPRRTKTPKGWFIWNDSGILPESVRTTLWNSHVLHDPEECSNSKMFGSKSNETCPKQTTIAFWAFWLNVIQKYKHNKRVSVCLFVFPQRGFACWTRKRESTFLGFHPGEVASTEGFCGRRPLVLRADAGRGEHPSRRPWRAPWLGWNIGDFTAKRDVKISNRPYH